MEKEWSNSFDFVDVNDAQKEAINKVRAKMKALANDLQQILPTDGEAGRYRAMVKTKLEEANWAATKGITRSTQI